MNTRSKSTPWTRPRIERRVRVTRRLREMSFVFAPSVTASAHPCRIFKKTVRSRWYVTITLWSAVVTTYNHLPCTRLHGILIKISSISFLRDISTKSMKNARRALSNVKRDFNIALLLRYMGPAIGRIPVEYKRINHLILERHGILSWGVAYALL